MDYKLTQAQYARIYGVTERSIRTYQGQGVPLDEPGKAAATLAMRKAPAPGLNPPQVATLLYSQEAGIPIQPVPDQTAQLEEIIWKFWDANNDITGFVRGHNWPNAEEIVCAGAEVSIMVQKMRALAGIPNLPAEPGENEDED